MENDFVLTDELLAKLNRFTRRTVTAEEVYTFPVVLCDNEIDRDGERFSDGALEQLAKLFVGKTGIFDHDPKSGNQTARIFECEVVTDGDRLTSFGAPYKQLLAKAYMMRTESNADLIKEIEGGIKKEVSVSCAAAEKRCSVCGRDRRSDPCGHIKGRAYEGRHCSDVLEGITDAYEWSFVAVPAQKQAGVLKGWKGGEQMTLKQLAQQAGEAALSELDALEQDAAVGRAYCKQLRQELLRLRAALGLNVPQPVLRAAGDKLSSEELRELHKALSEKAAEAYGPVTQLPDDRTDNQSTLETDYLI